MLKNLCLLSSCLLISATLFAQSIPPGEGPWRGVPVWLGAELSVFNPDYGCSNNLPLSCLNNQLVGVTTYGFANHVYRKLGVEAEARLLRWGGPGYMTQINYLAGPRLDVLRYKNLMLSPKLLFGENRITLRDGKVGSGNYFAFAPGAVLDYRVSRRVCARVDYEYQRWPSFKGDGTGAGGLTPNGFSFGVSYMVLR